MKYIKQLQEFLEEELSDYSSFKYEIHFSDENKNYERYDVDIKQHDKDFSSVSFRLYENKIEIELCSYKSERKKSIWRCVYSS